MQIAICDDEKEIRELLGCRVKSLCPKADIIFYKTGEELLAAEKQPDILFLDIHDGRNNNTAPKKNKARTSVLAKLRQKQAEIAKRSGKAAPQMAMAEDMERRRK